MYREGLAYPVSNENARKWFQEAAARGSTTGAEALRELDRTAATTDTQIEPSTATPTNTRAK